MAGVESTRGHGVQMILVNVGCGILHRPGWLNLDLEPADPGVSRWDLRRGIPLEPATADAVYMSHVLEHLDREDARRAIADAARVLRLGGVIRIVVPDLEQQCRQYLAALDEAAAGEPGADRRHMWMQLELLDQLVRTRTGGDLLAFLLQAPESERAFIRARIGAEAERYWNEEPASLGARLGVSMHRGLLRRLPGMARRRIAEALVRVVVGRSAAHAFREGLFRTSGEVHRWMYDRVSLRRLLEAGGFGAFRVTDAWTSAIPGFADFELDASSDRVRKPESIFTEALRV